ncbi:hypothetical protein [Streptomyces sp. NPDC056672]|uniref:hypothetical protein n=1 Tax=Streptomyces sp. NPDC056672 TaxID=3345906 RepID=UPI0036BDBB23
MARDPPGVEGGEKGDYVGDVGGFADAAEGVLRAMAAMGSELPRDQDAFMSVSVSVVVAGTTVLTVMPPGVEVLGEGRCEGVDGSLCRGVADGIGEGDAGSA